MGGHLYTHCASAATVLSVGGPPREHRIENIHGSPVFGPRPKGDAMGEWWLREVKAGMMEESFGASGDVPSLRAIARRRREDGRPYLRSRTAPREREVRPSPRAWPTSRRYRPPPLDPRREDTSESAERKGNYKRPVRAPSSLLPYDDDGLTCDFWYRRAKTSERETSEGRRASAEAILMRAEVNRAPTPGDIGGRRR